jgi:hypothetical protein
MLISAPSVKGRIVIVNKTDEVILSREAKERVLNRFELQQLADFDSTSFSTATEGRGLETKA